MLDLIIKGGQVVTPDRVAELELGIQEGKIVLISEPGTITAEARRAVDARGNIVVPGGIECHSHISSPVPSGVAGREGVKNQSPDGATRAAAFGGTTTVVAFVMRYI